MVNIVNLEQPTFNQRTPPNVSQLTRSQNRKKAKLKSLSQNHSNASPTAKPNATTRKTARPNSHSCANVASENLTKETLDTAQFQTSKCFRKIFIGLSWCGTVITATPMIVTNSLRRRIVESRWIMEFLRMWPSVALMLPIILTFRKRTTNVSVILFLTALKTSSHHMPLD